MILLVVLFSLLAIVSFAIFIVKEHEEATTDSFITVIIVIFSIVAGISAYAIGSNEFENAQRLDKEKEEKEAAKKVLRFSSDTLDIQPIEVNGQTVYLGIPKKSAEATTK